MFHDIVAREHRLCLPATNLHDDVFRHPRIAHVDGRADPQIMNANTFVCSALGVTHTDARRVSSLVPLIAAGSESFGIGKYGVLFSLFSFTARLSATSRCFNWRRMVGSESPSFCLHEMYFRSRSVSIWLTSYFLKNVFK